MDLHADSHVHTYVHTYVDLHTYLYTYYDEDSVIHADVYSYATAHV
jgi:hypothetical protein